MKVMFNMSLADKEFSQVVNIDEKDIKGIGYTPSNKLNIKLDEWTMSNIRSSFKIMDDDRFEDEEFNMPRIDEEMSEKLGWSK